MEAPFYNGPWQKSVEDRPIPHSDSSVDRASYFHERASHFRGLAVAAGGIDDGTVEAHISEAYFALARDFSRIASEFEQPRRPVPQTREPKRCTKTSSILAATHLIKLDAILDAFETFGRAARTNALKVITGA